MTCDEVQHDDLVERYLANQLADAGREAFEQHYFACDNCFADLEAVRAVQSALQSRALEIRTIPSRIRYQWVVGLAVAASLFIAIGIVWRTTHVSLERAAIHPAVAIPRPPDYSELARVSPPVYNPPLLRSTVTPNAAVFGAAMENYRSREYAKAIAPLKSAVETDPADPAPRFYLAACYLLTSQAAAAVPELQSVLKLNDTRFEEESHFLLGKAWLQQNRPNEAREELQKVATQTGDFTEQAKSLLAQLDTK